MLLLAMPLAAAGWGGRLHMDISREAAQSVPDDMKLWRMYARLMARYSIQPDLWKDYEAAEGERHYIDLEAYAPLAATNLPPDPTALRSGLYRYHGHLPWVIADLQAKLTAAMATGNWVQAASLAAAQGHYVGDLHQPLHTTENYDGQLNGQNGVHMRWESDMPGAHWRSALMPETHAEYISNLWPAVLGWLDRSHGRAVDVLAADYDATRVADPNRDPDAYYEYLWQTTGDLFVEQVHRAATDLGSLWYTAWVDAGRPEIPPPPASLSETSVWAPEPQPEGMASWPFLAAFGVIAFVIVLLSMRRRPETHHRDPSL